MTTSKLKMMQINDNTFKQKKKCIFIYARLDKTMACEGWCPSPLHSQPKTFPSSEESCVPICWWVDREREGVFCSSDQGPSTPQASTKPK